MSVQKPTKDELAYWEKQIDSVGRGINKRRLRYGVGDNVQAFNITWRKADLYQKIDGPDGRPKGKEGQDMAVPHCQVCGRSFIATRSDAKTCGIKCRVKKSRSVTHKPRNTYAEGSK